MGEKYGDGVGVVQNYEKAFRLFEKAALQGNAYAQKNLGYMFMFGLDVRRNYAEAREWFEQAAAQDAKVRNMSRSVRGDERKSR